MLELFMSYLAEVWAILKTAACCHSSA